MGSIVGFEIVRSGKCYQVRIIVYFCHSLVGDTGTSFWSRTASSSCTNPGLQEPAQQWVDIHYWMRQIQKMERWRSSRRERLPIRPVPRQIDLPLCCSHWYLVACRW